MSLNKLPDTYSENKCCGGCYHVLIVSRDDLQGKYDHAVVCTLHGNDVSWFGSCANYEEKEDE